MIDLQMNFTKLSFTESSASGAAAVASKAKQKGRTKTEKVTRRIRRNRMRVLIPQICVASRLLEIFQKMQLRGRRNGHKYRVVGSSSHRKRKKEEAAADDARSSSSSRAAATTTTRATSGTLQRRKPKAELGLGFRPSSSSSFVRKLN
jgi:hypothetical protein